MVDISTKTWNKAEVSVTKIHENDNENKTALLLLCISCASKKWGGKNPEWPEMTWLVKKLK